MAKQIKVIKCPSCGNNKPTSLGNDRFSCEKCGTEFFLDNDDININVNHNHNNNSHPIAKKQSKSLVLIFTILGGILFLYIIFFVVGSVFFTNTPKTTTPKTPKMEYSKRKISRSATNMQLVSNGSEAVLLCIDRDINKQKGFYFVFYNYQKDSIISTQKASNEVINKIKGQYFYSSSNDYYILNDKRIWELNSQKLTINDITDSISKSKPALNAGFSSIHFVDKGKGDGLIVETNLGKTFYYYPHPNQLFTEKAFIHLSEGGIETVKENAKLRSYYLFLNKNSKESSNVAQLMQITYKYNDGGPENQKLFITEKNINQTQPYRIVSTLPIGKEKICFSPSILYSDSINVMVSYKPTLANDAHNTLELFNINGDTIWKLEENIQAKDILRIGSVYYILTIDNLIYEIQNNGSTKVVSL